MSNIKCNCPLPTLLTNLFKTDKDLLYTSVTLLLLFINSVGGRWGEGGAEIWAITAEYVIVIRMLLKRDNLYWRGSRPSARRVVLIKLPEITRTVLRL